jgi:hypothetical protein
MPVTFSQFRFDNGNNVSVALVLEGPVGTQLVNTNVGPMATYNSMPNVNNVPSAKITVTAAGHNPDDETIRLSGAPYGAFIETLTTRSSIGTISGNFTARFN